MYFAIPDFATVPNAGTLQTISIVSLIVGFCLVGGGVALPVLAQEKGEQK